jgi:hypothetical protein
MKKSIILIALLVSTMAASAQKKDFFNLENEWMKMVGYSYQPGYPYGFSLAGGSFLSMGFAEEGARYDISATEYREPTWSLRFGWLGYNFDKDITGLGAVSFRPMLVMGINKTKDVTTEDNGYTWTKEGNTYFTMAPSIVVNVYMVHFSLGYEIVPKFKELNGLNFGIGFSIPYNRDKASEKAQQWIDKRNASKRKVQ